VVLALAAAVLCACGAGPSEKRRPPEPVERDAFSSDVAGRPQPPPILRGTHRAAVAEVSRSTASGRFAFAQAYGVVDAPRGLRLVVRASPDQPVDVRWTTTCTRDTRSGSRIGQLRHRTPIDRPLPIAVPVPDSCVAAVNATLDQGGTLRLRVLARYTTEP
jgi:hypothetical protein